jgi:hypothetical protein
MQEAPRVNGNLAHVQCTRLCDADLLMERRRAGRADDSR